MRQYELKESIYFLVNLKDGNTPLTLSGYSENAAYDDVEKGKVTLSIQKIGESGYAEDAEDISMDHIPMFANGTNYSQATGGTPNGFDEEGEYVATVWYTKKESGQLKNRRLKRIQFSVINSIPTAEPE
jgi:hypothetical protein